MKQLLLCTSLALSQIFFWHNDASALKYTSVTSGNFSSTGTWLGGIIPPVNFSLGDTIVIDNGHNVILDQDITLSHSIAQLDVRGILRSSGSEYINFNGSGKLSVSGTLDIDSMVLVNVTNADINGQCMVKKLRCLIFSATGNGSLIISERLHVYGSLSNTGGHTINIAPNAEIYMWGGEIIPTGTGIFTLPGSYDVIYTGAAHTKPTGMEVSGSGLRHVTVNLLSDTSELKLGADLGIGNGTLSLSKGILTLNNHTLRFGPNGDLAAAGNGKIKSTSASDIEVNVTNSLSGPLTFTGNGNTVRDLVVNCGGTAKLGNALKVTGKVDFQSGKLDVQGYKLSLITGATVSGADANKYIITGAGGSLAADIGSGASFTYQVGTGTEYTPCIISSNNNTVYNGMSVGVSQGVKVFGTSGNDMAASQPMVNTTWFIEHVNPTVDIDLELMWSSNNEVNAFDRNNAYISHLVGNYWDKDATTAATVNANGHYSIKRASIKSLSPFAVFDRNTVGLNELAVTTAVKAYPNPVADIMYIESAGRGEVFILNTSGQLVQQIQLKEGVNTIFTGNIQPGTYFTRIVIGDTVYNQSFLKH